MNNKDTVSEFVREALVAGRSRDEIAMVLPEAGWTASEVAEGLDGFAPGDFVPPVPRPRSTLSARDFFVYALMFGALCFASGYLISLLHGLIDWAFEEECRRRSRSSLRFAVAVLVVAGPLYGWLNWREGRKIAADPAMVRSIMRKWMIYMTLLASAAVLCGALVASLNALLSGDLTAQFILKAGAVVIIAALILTYYRREAGRVTQ